MLLTVESINEAAAVAQPRRHARRQRPQRTSASLALLLHYAMNRQPCAEIVMQKPAQVREVGQWYAL